MTGRAARASPRCRVHVCVCALPPRPQPPSGPAPPTGPAAGVPAEYKFYTEFQSHESEFDFLKSLEIEEKINKICWCLPSNGANFLLSTNGAWPWVLEVWGARGGRAAAPAVARRDGLCALGSVAWSSAVAPCVRVAVMHFHVRLCAYVCVRVGCMRACSPVPVACC